jgi:hypothetical protein
MGRGIFWPCRAPHSHFHSRVSSPSRPIPTSLPFRFHFRPHFHSIPAFFSISLAIILKSSLTCKTPLQSFSLPISPPSILLPIIPTHVVFCTATASHRHNPCQTRCPPLTTAAVRITNRGRSANRHVRGRDPGEALHCGAKECARLWGLHQSDGAPRGDGVGEAEEGEKRA